ncbi:hypothetical protein K3495_g12632 [Podosphaera aphanis]|nr:hypothetical protein K3495_g12632 [Podosphaera aphanis]
MAYIGDEERAAAPPRMGYVFDVELWRKSSLRLGYSHSKTGYAYKVGSGSEEMAGKHMSTWMDLCDTGPKFEGLLRNFAIASTLA